MKKLLSIEDSQNLIRAQGAKRANNGGYPFFLDRCTRLAKQYGDPEQVINEVSSRFPNDQRIAAYRDVALKNLAKMSFEPEKLVRELPCQPSPNTETSVGKIIEARMGSNFGAQLDDHDLDGTGLSPSVAEAVRVVRTSTNRAYDEAIKWNKSKYPHECPKCHTKECTNRLPGDAGICRTTPISDEEKLELLPI